MVINNDSNTSILKSITSRLNDINQTLKLQTNIVTQIETNAIQIQSQVTQIKVVLIIFFIVFALLFALTTKRICIRLENVENIIFKNDTSYEKGTKLFVPKDFGNYQKLKFKDA